MPLHIPITEAREISDAEYEISQAPETQNAVVPITDTDETSLGSRSGACRNVNGYIL
ncbi:hypothetical protein ES703_125505 [subsurface metagenome]